MSQWLSSAAWTVGVACLIVAGVLIVGFLVWHGWMAAADLVARFGLMLVAVSLFLFGCGLLCAGYLLEWCGN